MVTHRTIEFKTWDEFTEKVNSFWPEFRFSQIAEIKNYEENIIKSMEVD
jgi:hypothetical protein